MNWTQRLSPNRFVGRPRTSGVILHSTRGNATTPGQEYAGTISWFLNPASQVSAHRVIHVTGEGAICVADGDRAWHARSYNEEWLSVELVQQTITTPFTEAQYQTLSALLKEWSQTYGFPLDRDHLRGHDEIDTVKSDPGPQFDWNRLLTLLEDNMPRTPEQQRIIDVIWINANERIRKLKDASWELGVTRQASELGIAQAELNSMVQQLEEMWK